MEKIYKYKLEITDYQIIDLPKNAKILSVMSQPPAYGEVIDSLYMWAGVDDDNPIEPRRIRIFGTGNPMAYEHKLKFIGTVSMNSNSLIWHVFENIMENE